MTPTGGKRISDGILSPMPTLSGVALSQMNSLRRVKKLVQCSSTSFRKRSKA